MKKLIALFALFSLSAQAVVVPGPFVSYIPVAGRLLPTAGLIRLDCFMNQGATGNYATCRKDDASAGYTPSGSKKFRVAAAQAFPIAGVAASKDAILCYGDNDVGQSSTTSPTNVKYPTNTQGAGTIMPDNINPTPASPAFETLWDFQVPNGKYPCIVANTGLTIRVALWGYEE